MANKLTSCADGSACHVRRPLQELGLIIKWATDHTPQNRYVGLGYIHVHCKANYSVRVHLFAFFKVLSMGSKSVYENYHFA